MDLRQWKLQAGSAAHEQLDQVFLNSTSYKHVHAIDLGSRMENVFSEDRLQQLSVQQLYSLVIMVLNMLETKLQRRADRKRGRASNGSDPTGQAEHNGTSCLVRYHYV